MLFFQDQIRFGTHKYRFNTQFNTITLVIMLFTEQVLISSGK